MCPVSFLSIRSDDPQRRRNSQTIQRVDVAEIDGSFFFSDLVSASGCVRCSRVKNFRSHSTQTGLPL
jgi:hypothetical protein